jgi:hypothetical protein
MARLKGQPQVIAVIRDIEPLERPPQNLEVEPTWDLAGPLGRSFDDVDIGQTKRVQSLDNIGVGPCGITVEVGAIDRTDR